MKTRKQIRLLYLTCSEIIANYGIFDTQVKSLLKVLAKNNASLRVDLFSLVPVIRLVKWRVEVVFLRYKKSFDNIEQELAAVGIRSSIKPLLSVYPFDTWRIFEMIIALPLAIFMLIVYVRRHRINLLHCRSYHAGLLGLIIKKLMRVPYIFDPRSSWIGEQVLMGKLVPRSLSYHLWRKLEAEIVRNAHVCIVVSDPMKERFAAAQRVEVVYTTASDLHFQPDDIKELNLPEQINQLEKLKCSHKLFVFNSGSFNQWNNLDYLLEQYKKLDQAVSKSALVIISHSPQAVISQAITAHGINPANTITLNLASNFVPLALRRCDYGLVVMPQSVKSPEIMSVKFAEYLAAGLPVICDEYIGGAAHVIKHHQVGMLLSSDWVRNKKEFDQLQGAYPEVSERCRNVAKELFSVNKHAEKYAELYQKVVA